MNQGLHHLPQSKIMFFLSEVYRILKPSGIFIVREHNATEDIIPLLDLAHSVFNAVLDVPYEQELNEIRAFRTIEDWKNIIPKSGLHNSYI